MNSASRKLAPSGEAIGSVDLGVAGTFSWYATALGLPIIMPVSGYVSSVIPVLLMVWFGSILERWLKSWMPAALKMFLVPLATMTVSIVLGYLVIGPVATLITNLLSAAFSFIRRIITNSARSPSIPATSAATP